MAPVYSTEQVDDLKSVAGNFGIDPIHVAEILQKYGPSVLQMVISALKSGFSLSFCLELLKTFGPVVLDFVMSLFDNTKKAMDVSVSKGLVPESMDNFLNEKDAENFAPILVKIIVEKVIPYVIKNYGQQILQALLESLNKAFEDKESAQFLKVLATLR
jgi:hypothetical protein